MGMEWSILGIEATTDKEEITKAYRNVLKRTNPEDDPEGFKRLRGAYDAALMHAEEALKDSSDQKEKTPLDLWADRLSDVYNDFSKRKNPSCWEELYEESDPFLRQQIDNEIMKFERILEKQDKLAIEHAREKLTEFLDEIDSSDIK